MKWRIVKVLVGVLLPAVLEAIVDGRVTPEEVDDLLVALLDGLDALQSRQFGS